MNSESRKIGAIWWRLEARLEAGIHDEGADVALNWIEYTVTKVTPKGVWLVPAASWSRSYKPKFALSGCCRWASPTKSGAAVRFTARKNRQIAICRAQIEEAEEAIELVKQWVDEDK